MTRHPKYGTIYVNQDLCVGCGSCVEACPFKIPYVDENLEKSFKCWSCIDRQDKGKTTACANTCPTGALRFGDRDKLLKIAKKRLQELKKAGKKAFIYGVKELDGLGMIYVLPEELKDYNLPANPQVIAYLPEIEKLIKPFKEKGKLTPEIVKKAWKQVKKRHHLG